MTAVRIAPALPGLASDDVCVPEAFIVFPFSLFGWFELALVPKR
jgi:hypothetical protein